MQALLNHGRFLFDMKPVRGTCVGFVLAVAVCGAVEAFVFACYLIGQNR